MGLSSSQARLLHLTGRMHQIEYKAAKLEAEKLRMANESRRVYLDYQNALEATKIQRATLNTDGSLNYVDATYNALLKDGYRLGKCEYMAVSQDDIDTFNTVADKNPAEFAAIKAGYAVKQGNEVLQTANNSIQLIYTADQLKAAVANGTQNIVLMDDINVTESLGTLTSNLNGNGHSINVSGTTGIFTSIDNGSVQNLAINANISGNTENIPVGCLSGMATGNVKFENITVNGTIDNGELKTNNDIGGLIGQTDGADTSVTINNVTTNVTVKGGCDSGGLVGCMYGKEAHISNVTAIVTNDSGGGLIGKIGMTDPSTVNNCKVDVNISQTLDGAVIMAGIIRDIGSSPINIDSCYATGTLYANCTSNNSQAFAAAGGIVGAWGHWQGGNPNEIQTITNCYSDVNITTTANNGGYTSQGDIAGLVWGGSTNPQNIVNCASKKGTAISTLAPSHSSTFTSTEANDSNSVKSLISSVGSKCSLSQTYNPSDETTINVEGTNTVGADYDYYLEIGQAIADDKYFLLDGHEDDTEWLTNLVNSGFVTIQKKDEDGKFFDTSVSTDTHLQEVADETGLRKAEAKYEADMKRIDNKDKKFDYDLAALDNERNAIKQEMETLKTVAKDNVERTFKLFS